MSYGLIEDVVQDDDGNPIAGASITVYGANTSTEASLYANASGTPISNPTTTNSNGIYNFYAAYGSYDLKIEKTGYNTKWVYDVQAYPAPTFDGQVYVSQYDSLTDAIAAIASDTKTLYIDTHTTITANTTIPSNVSVVSLNTGLITKTSTYTLTINGPFEAGLYQVFSGFAVGDVTFGVYSTSIILAEWFGAASESNSGAAINAALSAATKISASAELGGQFGSLVKLGSGRFLIEETISVPANVNFEGAGKLTTILQAVSPLTSGSAVIKFAGYSHGQTRARISRMTISGNNIAGIVGVNFWDGTGGGTQNNYTSIYDCYITRCAIGVKLDSTSASKYIIYSEILETDFSALISGGVGIEVNNAVNYFRVHGCSFNLASTQYGIKTLSTSLPDYFDISDNSFDGALYALYLDAVGGIQALSFMIHNNRFENNTGIYINSTYLTADIHHNWFTDMAGPAIYTNGKNNRIVGNEFFIKSGDNATYAYAIEIGSGAENTFVGRNGYGRWGESTFSPLRYKNAGYNTTMEQHVWASASIEGTHEAGDVLMNRTQYCSVAGTVSSGAGATTGTVDADTFHITIAAPAGYVRGAYILINGTEIRKITYINTSTGYARLYTAATPGAGLSVAISPPTYATH